MDKVSPPIETNKWRTKNAQELMRKHSAINFVSGIHHSFVKSADNTYINSESEIQSELSEFARWELPIRVVVDWDWFGKIEGDAYFLEKYNPNTGEGLETSYGDGKIWVAYLDREGNVINPEHEYNPRSEDFTDEQIALIFQQAQELEDAGLTS